MSATTSGELRATAWLSRDLAELASELRLGEESPPDTAKFHFDVLIVGSGYGAAMALYELAGRTSGGTFLRIAMLERGEEYLPGAFPSRMADLAGHVRFSTAGRDAVSGNLDGLFDLRIGSDVNVLQANGLGGGSLINAGVMAPPLASVFDEPCWPKEIRYGPPSAQDFCVVAGLLRASSAAQYAGRDAAMTLLGGSNGAKAAQVTVASSNNPRRAVRHCIQCGDCATGCNFGAKLSLDVTLIADACERHRSAERDGSGCVRIVTGATVTTFVRNKGSGWKVSVVHTDPHLQVRQQPKPYEIRTRYLVVAAGTLGSTELLMRARSKVWLSPMLGERFSANGDNISALYAIDTPVKGSAREDDPYDPPRGVGPTITRIIDLRDAEDKDRRVVIEDLAIPGPLRRMLDEVLTTSMTVRSLNEFDCATYGGNAGTPPPDPAGINGDELDASMVVATIGRDRADGRLIWPPHVACPDEGRLGVSWPAIHDEGELDRNQETLEELAAGSKHSGTPLRNPMWRPLPGMLDKLFGPIRGAAFTVHPLGGCVMGDSGATAVVNHLGQVYRGLNDAVYSDLVVLDGSIVPCSLGINPALTIATLARRAIRDLCSAAWGLGSPQGTPVALPQRLKFRDVPEPTRLPATSVQMTERMKATATIDLDGKRTQREIEIELRFDDIPVTNLVGFESKRVLTVHPEHSCLRIFEVPPKLPLRLREESKLRKWVADPVRKPLFEAPLRGTLTLMRHEPSTKLWRICRAMSAWFINRGLRDIVEDLTQRFVDMVKARSSPSRASLGELLCSALRLASRAGDVRLLEYQLKLGKPMVEHQTWEGAEIRAVKRLTYECAANPLTQLQQAKMTRFPGWQPTSSEALLTVDLPFFGQAGVPLVRIFSQTNQPNALVDLASLGLYILRVLLPLHAWTMRLPDRPLPRVANRLPGCVAGLPNPEVTELAMPPCRGAQSVRLRLTRYRPADVDATKPPVMLIHGYSASGTTFVHPTLPDRGLVGALCAKNRDVWVLDLRSSAGMPTAQIPWTFEEMGCQDIPLAVDYICTQTGHAKLDIVAHCMGAAMLSLGLFPNDSLPKEFDCYPKLREALPDRIRRLVLSQVGPAVVMSPANTARAYIMQWLQHYVNLGPFELTPPAVPSADDMVDRLLSVVPYPRSDFWRENPFWRPWKRTRWVGTRHRMDSLYGVTFKLDGVPDPVLDAIDDFFGPMSLKTVAQVILFARCSLVSDSKGSGAPVPSRMTKSLKCHVMCLHSTQNGLVDIETRRRLIALLLAAGTVPDSIEMADMGHQDSLIGENARIVYGHITEFLEG